MMCLARSSISREILIFGTSLNACFGRTDLVVEIERRGDEAGAVGADEQRADPPEQHRLGDRRDIRGAQALADQIESLLGALVRRSEIIGPVKIDIVDLIAIDERRNRERLVAVGNRRGDLVRFENGVFVLGDLIALDLILPLDDRPRRGVDELA